MPAVRRTVLVVLLLGLLSSAAAPLASAEPRDPSIKDIQYVYVAIHLDASSCLPFRGSGPFGTEGSKGHCSGTFTAGHTGRWNGPFSGSFDYGAAPGDLHFGTVVELGPTSDEDTPHLSGYLGSRGSGNLLPGAVTVSRLGPSFTFNPWIDPNRPADTKGGPLRVNVAAHGAFESGEYDVYVNGYVPVGDPAAP